MPATQELHFDHGVHARRAHTDGAGRHQALRHVPLGAGIFLLLLAVLLPTYAYPRLAVLPDDPQIAQVQHDPSGTVLMADADVPAGARVLTDVPVTITTFVSKAPEPAPDGVVVWRLATSTEAEGHGLANARVETVSLDRRTTLPVNCCGDRLVTEQGDDRGEPLEHSGGVAWPLNVKKQGYPMWDVQIRRARTAAYVGEEERDGFDTYKFEAVTPLEKIGTMELPGALFGSAQPSVTADAEYQDTRTFWIEPATGNVIDLQEKLLQQFRFDGRVVTAVQAELDSPPIDAELREQTELGAMMLPWLRFRASVVLVVLGLALLAWWGYREFGGGLTRRSTNRSASRWASEEAPGR